MLRIIVLLLLTSPVFAQSTPSFAYTVSIPQAGKHVYHIVLRSNGWTNDTVTFNMPNWTPGYYQFMAYSKAVENFTARDERQQKLSVKKLTDNTWQVTGTKKKTIYLEYDVTADKQFVAHSYLDSTRGYIVPAGIFLYAEGHLNKPVSITLNVPAQWTFATGLQSVPKKKNEFTAPDFDILYDCPILMGKLEELPSFRVKGIEHRFIGYALGNFDKALFMKNLEKITTAASAIIGDIPFDRYTFIGIGPGRGGIEHLNNTTVSFDGNELTSPEAINRVLNFLTHEYFHHYNVKRIRPFELGPFDYDNGSKTNLLWISEGLTVYYEYLIMKRAGLIDEKIVYADLESNINATENNPGRFHQSLIQASYNTWSDGPFGKTPAGKSISYYDKGPVTGLLLDFAIRHASQNKKSLDDVMRFLYWQYYKKQNRGFTDAEFMHACETMAGTSLANFFDYIYTTRELDYNTYLGYAGLTVHIQNNDGEKKYTIHRIEKPDALQQQILTSWLEGK